jgi:hypothetical protein
MAGNCFKWRRDHHSRLLVSNEPLLVLKPPVGTLLGTGGGLHMNKTSWSFAALGMTLAGAAIAFYVWSDFWRGAIIGLIAGAAVRTLQVLVSQQVTWASAVRVQSRD